MDFTYIASQTFGDRELEAELLTLFVDQARRLLLALATQTPHDQGETAHLLKGSARAIGATRVAVAAEAYEATSTVATPGDPAALQNAADLIAARSAAFQQLATAIAETEAAIAAHLARPEATLNRS